jgi:alpha-glucosidase (family GH31 glycosyl hydrolase)
MKYSFKILDGEYWWGGSSNDGIEMPFSSKTEGYIRDFRVSCPNQTMPLYISSMGRYIWSEYPFAVVIDRGVIELEGRDIIMVQAGSCLRDAYLAASKAHFPFGGEVPPVEFFKTAQYNTWMEFTYEPSQKGVLEYAHAIIDNGFKPGILIIDEGWQRQYGDWRFDNAKFPDPKSMVDELHALGFTVMLWVVPYVNCNGVNFIRKIWKKFNPEESSKTFMRNENGKPIIMEWWNGYSAILDMTNPIDVKFLDIQLQVLMRDYGVDGFKFDGGTPRAYTNDMVINGEHRGTASGTYNPHEKNIAWNEFGMRYRFHEYKDTFKGGGKPVIQRLCDRNHRWDEDGINTILPNSIVQGLIGHPFICPDMIGGGEWSYNVIPGFKVDEELFIRMAQASVFFPMMQFSWAPWRVLSADGLEAVKECAELHSIYADEIIEIINESAKSGEPVLRSLEYSYPHNGYAEIKDEFLCGDNILVCPVVTKGTFQKEIVFPEGRWVDVDGNVYTEGKHPVQTPINKLKWFRRAEK